MTEAIHDALGGEDAAGGSQVRQDIGTYCTGGSPRFDVETTAGGVYAFGCASGTHAPLSPGWERITFSNADVQVLSGPAWPGFGSATLSFLQLLQDEAGSTTADNLQVNGIVRGKPGATGP